MSYSMFMKWLFSSSPMIENGLYTERERDGAGQRDSVIGE